MSAIKNDDISEMLRFFARIEPRIEPVHALLDHGRYFEPVAHLPAGFKKGPLGHCYENCTRAIMQLIANGDSSYYYAEGFAVESTYRTPFEHAWLVNTDGEVIDLTWENTEGAVYYGVTFRHAFLLDVRKMARTYGILNNVEVQHRLHETPTSFEAVICKPSFSDRGLRRTQRDAMPAA